MLCNKMPFPPKDGGAIATLSLALSLQKCGNEISILTMNTSKHYCNINDVSEYVTNNLEISDVNINTDINIFKLLLNLFFSKKPYNAERFISKDFENRLIDILKTEKYDIIQLEGLFVCPYIDVIRKYSDAKIAFRAHNVEYEIWERKIENEKNILKKIYFKNLSKRIKKYEINNLNKYDFLIPITYRDGEKFNEIGNQKPIYVVQTGINTERYEVTDKEPEFPGFFHIGALDWLPNQEGLIWFFENIWTKFIERHHDAKFYLAGRNAPKEFIKYLKNKNIEFLGEIEDANDFINSKSIMIVPLLSGSGMRIKIVEGMALKKTIITTKIGTEGINTTHNENIFIADSPENFLNCLENIYNNKSLHRKISENAKIFIDKNFNNYDIAKQLMEFYQKNLNIKLTKK